MLTDTATPEEIVAELPPTTETELAEAQLVAVYGTLKQGYGNHWHIEENKLTFVKNATTEAAAYLMVGGRGFPFVHKGGSERIAVELYEFSDLKQIASMDRLEGHPRWYRREEVKMKTGETAWMYLQPQIAGNPTPSDVDRTRVTHKDGVSSWN